MLLSRRHNSFTISLCFLHMLRATCRHSHKHPSMLCGWVWVLSLNNTNRCEIRSQILIYFQFKKVNVPSSWSRRPKGGEPVGDGWEQDWVSGWLEGWVASWGNQQAIAPRQTIWTQKLLPAILQQVRGDDVGANRGDRGKKEWGKIELKGGKWHKANVCVKSRGLQQIPAKSGRAGQKAAHTTKNYKTAKPRGPYRGWGINRHRDQAFESCANCLAGRQLEKLKRFAQFNSGQSERILPPHPFACRFEMRNILFPAEVLECSWDSRQVIEHRFDFKVSF